MAHRGRPAGCRRRYSSDTRDNGFRYHITSRSRRADSGPTLRNVREAYSTASIPTYFSSSSSSSDDAHYESPPAYYNAIAPSCPRVQDTYSAPPPTYGTFPSIELLFDTVSNMQDRLEQHQQKIDDQAGLIYTQTKLLINQEDRLMLQKRLSESQETYLTTHAEWIEFLSHECEIQVKQIAELQRTMRKQTIEAAGENRNSDQARNKTTHNVQEERTGVDNAKVNNKEKVEEGDKPLWLEIAIILAIAMWLIALFLICTTRSRV